MYTDLKKPCEALQVVGDLNIFYSLGDSGVFITLWPRRVWIAASENTPLAW